MRGVFFAAALWALACGAAGSTFPPPDVRVREPYSAIATADKPKQGLAQRYEAAARNVREALGPLAIDVDSPSSGKERLEIVRIGQTLLPSLELFKGALVDDSQAAVDGPTAIRRAVTWVRLEGSDRTVFVLPAEDEAADGSTTTFRDLVLCPEGARVRDFETGCTRLAPLILAALRTASDLEAAAREASRLYFLLSEHWVPDGTLRWTTAFDLVDPAGRRARVPMDVAARLVQVPKAAPWVLPAFRVTRRDDSFVSSGFVAGERALYFLELELGAGRTRFSKTEVAVVPLQRG